MSCRFWYRSPYKESAELSVNSNSYCSMTTIKKAGRTGFVEETKLLKDLKPGDAFRFKKLSPDEMSTGELGADVFRVVKIQPEKAGRVSIISLDCLISLERDENHIVVPHELTIEVHDAKMVPASVS